jgi:hypothetical protein
VIWGSQAFHRLAVDAVFEKHGEGVRIREAPPPAKTDVALVAQRVHDRALVWLRRHRYLDERPAEDLSNEPPEDTPIDALARLALGGGSFVSRPFAADERVRYEDLDREEPRFSATCNGFDVHCAVRVEAGDDERRERFVRYCARPPFALERIERMKDGRLAYRLKTPCRDKTHRVMTPVEFLGRQAPLVPPRHLPLVRYHGVFGARSSWRALVTPKPPDGGARRKRKSKACSDDRQAGASSAAPAPVPVPARSTPQAGANDAAEDAAKAPPQADAAATTASAPWPSPPTLRRSSPSSPGVAVSTASRTRHPRASSGPCGCEGRMGSMPYAAPRAPAG